MVSRTLKKNKRTKHGRTRRQRRQRRRQMRGGEMKWLDIFKPTVKDAAYCQKQFDECNANIKPESDSAESSSDFSMLAKLQSPADAFLLNFSFHPFSTPLCLVSGFTPLLDSLDISILDP